MKQFYYYALVKGQSRPEALRSQSQVPAFEDGTRKPVHWAAFVLTATDSMSAQLRFLGILIVSVISRWSAIASGRGSY